MHLQNYLTQHSNCLSSVIWRFRIGPLDVPSVSRPPDVATVGSPDDHDHPGVEVDQENDGDQEEDQE